MNYMYPFFYNSNGQNCFAVQITQNSLIIKYYFPSWIRERAWTAYFVYKEENEAMNLQCTHSFVTQL